MECCFFSFLFLFYAVFLEYVDELMDLLFNEVILDPAPFVAEVKAVAVPGFLCEQYQRPEKADAVAGHVSRFSCPGMVGQKKLKRSKL